MEMCPEPSAQITKLLANWRGGDEQARDALIPLVYNELRRLARLRLWHQGPGHTAAVLGISPATVKREWATARVWLQRELKRNKDGAK